MQGEGRVGAIERGSGKAMSIAVRVGKSDDLRS